MKVRKTHRYLPADVRDALSAELRALRAVYGGSLPTPIVDEYAHQNDVSVRTIHRLSDDPTREQGARAKYVVDDDALSYIANAPNYRKAWEQCRDAGICDVGYPQFTRAVKDVDPAVLAGARHGNAAMVAKQGYMLRESEHRNSMWIIDHYEVPVFVRWPGFKHFVKPWQTTLIDDKHRTAMGAIWWPKAPTAEQTVAAVAAAVRGFELADGEFVGGSPNILLMDQGSEMVGEVATGAYLSMRIDPQPANARAPWVKGKLEVFHHDILDVEYASFPGWTGGPVDSAGRQINLTPATELLDRDTFRDRAWQILARYNVEHSHSSLGGLAPLESWLADPAPVRRIDDRILRQHWLAEARKVSGKGVTLHTLPYQHPLLTHEGARTLEVRYVPDDLTFVDVQLASGDWVRAVPQPLPPTYQQQLLALRAGQSRRVRAIHRQAKQLSADAHAAARAVAPPTPAAAPAPTLEERRTTNAHGRGPKPDDEVATAPPSADAQSAANAPAKPARRRPRRIAGSTDSTGVES